MSKEQAAHAAGGSVYTFACHEDEEQLCRMELRALFGCEPDNGWLESGRRIDPSRSPFIKLRADIRFAADRLSGLAEQAAGIELEGATFKVVCFETDGGETYEDKRAIEREVGRCIRGKADMRTPGHVFAVFRLGERWLLGDCRYAEPLWLKHNAKPQHYSTALGTRTARAIANIAVPEPAGVKAVDPCCGIGTVLVEALSMGIDIVGCEINPQAARGARANLRHFGLPDVVSLGDMRELGGHYDAAVLDLPYNLCSVLPEDERRALLEKTRELAARAVIVSTEPIEMQLAQAQFAVIDSCIVRKGTFARYVWLCG